MAFKSEGKKCPSSLFLQSVVGQFTPKWLGKNARSKQGKPLPYKLCNFTSSLCSCSASSATIKA